MQRIKRNKDPEQGTPKSLLTNFGIVEMYNRDLMVVCLGVNDYGVKTDMMVQITGDWPGDYMPLSYYDEFLNCVESDRNDDDVMFIYEVDSPTSVFLAFRNGITKDEFMKEYKPKIVWMREE
jgi:hypothetical protein